MDLKLCLREEPVIAIHGTAQKTIWKDYSLMMAQQIFLIAEFSDHTPCIFCQANKWK
jgi:hypothetical protein